MVWPSLPVSLSTSMLLPATTSVFAAFEALLIASATLAAVAKLSPGSSAVTVPSAALVRPDLFTSKVMPPLLLRAVVPVPLTKLT